MSAISHKPEHCNTINVYLFVDDGKAAIDFYVKAFDGVLGDLLEGPDGSIMHAAIQIGDSSLMLSREPAVGNEVAQISRWFSSNDPFVREGRRRDR